MWQFLGTLAISALGGTFLLHFLKNFILVEKAPLSWDWDGIIERALITYLIATNRWLFLIPVIILVKVIFRFALIGIFENLAKINAPGISYQKVKVKAELAFDLILSPAFAVLVGVIF